jgi:hypothetical protein
MNLYKFILLIKNLILFDNIFGDWGLGIGDWGLGPNPQYPIPIPNFY